MQCVGLCGYHDDFCCVSNHNAVSLMISRWGNEKQVQHGEDTRVRFFTGFSKIDQKLFVLKEVMRLGHQPIGRTC
jgi:hypothetical protein